jgi:predicted transcriptional regulator
MEKQRNKLRNFLKNNKISIPQLAKESGVSFNAIYRFLKGQDIRLSTWTAVEKIIDRQIKK